MVLLIDNYDSFSYNLYQLIGSVNPDIQVVRNDEISLGEIEKLIPDGGRAESGHPGNTKR